MHACDNQFEQTTSTARNTILRRSLDTSCRPAAPVRPVELQSGDAVRVAPVQLCKWLWCLEGLAGAGAAPIRSSTSRPSMTFPRTTCFPAHTSAAGETHFVITPSRRRIEASPVFVASIEL